MHAIQQETCISKLSKDLPLCITLHHAKSMPKKHGFHRIIYFCHMSFGSTHPSDEELLVLNGCFGAVIFPMPGSTWGSFMVFLSVLEILGCLALRLMTHFTLRFPRYILKHPKSYLKILSAFPAWMKKTLPSSHACGVHAVKSQTVKFSQDLADIF